MEKIIHKLISEFTKGIDTYTHNGSIWLIFTESKQWVIELTEEKTLWYNYTFFKSVFAYSSLNVVDNQQYITKWVEDNIINKVSDIHFRDVRDRKQQFEDTFENGVKETYLSENSLSKGIEYTLENGVKETRRYNRKINTLIEHTIKNGVKETQFNSYENKSWVEGVIKGGVKKTKMAHMKTKWSVEDTIENGVKETTALDPSFSVRYINGDFEMVPEVDKIIKSGVKETKSDDFNVSQFLCEEVIDKGVKETKISPTHTEYGDWLDGDEKLDEIIKNGVKETLRASYLNVDNVIQDGVKETKYNQSHQEPKFKEVLKNGVKEIHREICEYKHTVEHIIQTGVKETYDCDWDVPTDLIEGVINDGVKDTKVCNYTDPETQLITIKWGHCIDEVIENGTKNPTG
jgi:hypothetical protein